MTDETPIEESTTTNHGKKGRGNRWVPTDEQRRQVKMLAAMGTPHVDIGLVVGVSAPTLRKACKHELAVGGVEANAKVAQSLFRQATDPRKPNVAAGIFWAKSRMGWSDRPDLATGETPAKKQERQEAARRVGGGGKLAPGKGPKLKVVGGTDKQNQN